MQRPGRLIGISRGGFNGLQVAARAPEALKAVVTICSTVDREAFRIKAEGEAFEGDRLVHRKAWDRRVARDLI